MAVFLGDSGKLRIRRDSHDQALTTSLDPSDVNVNRNANSSGGQHHHIIGNK